MNASEPTPRPASSSVRRFVAALMLGSLVVATLWITAFSLATSMLIGAGCCVVVVAAGSVSGLVSALLDAVASVVMVVLAAAAAVLGAILAVFGS